MSVRSQPVVETKKQKRPHVDKTTVDGDNSQTRNIDGGQQ